MKHLCLCNPRGRNMKRWANAVKSGDVSTGDSRKAFVFMCAAHVVTLNAMDKLAAQCSITTEELLAALKELTGEEWVIRGEKSQ